MMNYPGVIFGCARRCWPSWRASPAGRWTATRPACAGQQLNAYVAAGIGSDHECTTVEEAAEKLARGLYILIREATNAHNLETLLPLVTARNSRRCCFCTDDRQPADLLDQGGIDYHGAHGHRRAASTRSPRSRWRRSTPSSGLACTTAARWRLAGGPILIVFDRLDDLRPRLVYAAGQLVAQDGVMTVAAAGHAALPAAQQHRTWPGSRSTWPSRPRAAACGSSARSRTSWSPSTWCWTPHPRRAGRGRRGPRSAQDGRDRAPPRQRQRGQGLHQEPRPASAARWPPR